MRLAFLRGIAVRSLRGDAGAAESAGDLRFGRDAAAAGGARAGRARSRRLGACPCRPRPPPGLPRRRRSRARRPTSVTRRRASTPASGEGARPALEAFVAHHGHRSAAPRRRAHARAPGAAARRAGAAKRLLDPLVASPPMWATGSSARYYLGLAELRLGKSRARASSCCRSCRAPGAARAGRRGDGGAARRAGRGDRRHRRPARGASSCGTVFARARASTRRPTRERGRASSRRSWRPRAAWRLRGSRRSGGSRARCWAPKAAAYLRAQNDAAGAAFDRGRDRGGAPRAGFRRVAAARGRGIRRGSAWRCRCRASSSRSARPRCAPRCWRWGRWPRRRRSR